VDQLFTFDNLVALLTLTGLEIVLGIDNVVFIAILAGKLPKRQQAAGRQVGLGLAMLMRICLLLTISWVMGLTADLFRIPSFWTTEAGDMHGVSGRDLIMLVGGLFLIGKATSEIHDKLEGSHADTATPATVSFGAVIFQIVLIDIVFSLDSVITAVGMVSAPAEAQWVGISVMVAAIVIAVLVMLLFAGAIARFVDHHPTMKILALSFLILIGVVLVAEGFHMHIPKGYVYFSMFFALGVEMLNLRLRRSPQPVKLHQHYESTALNETSGRSLRG
jgi:predicted tellurium resistance membrane protein TerC